MSDRGGSLPAATFDGMRPAFVFRGVIVDVNVKLYTVAVASEAAKKVLTGIAFASPYQHPNNGEGIYAMPEVGSICWVCDPSTGDRPFVMAWGPYPSETGDASNNKMQLNPGDIYLGTRDENFMILRRGGVVQIGGGPLSQRIFLPINNTIKDFCENYTLNTLAGDFEWSIGRAEMNTDGKHPAHVVLKARQFADDPQPVAQLEIGSHEGDTESILSLLIWDSGVQGHSVKFSLFIDKSGDMQFKTSKDVNGTVEGKFDLTVTGDMTMTTKAKANIKAALAATLQGATVLVQSNTGGITLKSSGEVVVTAPSGMTVEGGSQYVVLESLVTWCKTHTHTTASQLGVPSIPSTPPPTDAISKKLKSA